MLNTFILATLLAAQLPAETKPSAPAPLTQVETMAIEILELRAQLAEAQGREDACRADLAPLRTPKNREVVQDQASKLKAALESTRKGYVWDWAKRQFVPAPVPKAAAPKPVTPPVEK